MSQRVFRMPDGLFKSFYLGNRKTRYAYVFYATDIAYATAVLVFVRLLKELGIRSDVDLIILHLPLPEHILKKMRQMGIVTRRVPELRYTYSKYFEHSLVKLRVFELTKYERLIFLDADAIPLKTLDDLFEIKFSEPIAAPIAYWLPQPFWTTAMLVVKPSRKCWDRVKRQFPAAREKRFYDMDIVNAEFAGEICTLPQGCFSLNSEWEDTNRPSFWADPVEAYSSVSVIHFTALGKPWSYSVEEVRRLRPTAYETFYDLWKMWRDARDEIMSGAAEH